MLKEQLFYVFLFSTYQVGPLPSLGSRGRRGAYRFLRRVCNDGKKQYKRL